jgi:methyl-accepting chemotaxis protein
MSKEAAVAVAMRSFADAFNRFGSEASIDREDERRALAEYYTKQFGAVYSERNPGSDGRVLERLQGLSPTTLGLQYRYIAANPHPLGEKEKLSALDERTSYAELHARFHPQMRRFLEQFGYYDIFLVEPDRGHIVYSVFKELDFATSLLDGPYADSGIARAFRSARDGKKVVLTDFQPYYPSYEGAASFVAAPITEGSNLLGVLIFQMPISRINDVMTSGGAWKEIGLGASGEAYLVGPDQLLRSESRFLLEDASGYAQALRGAGVDTATIGSITAKGSSIGLQPVRTPGVERALAGEKGFAAFPDYRNVEVFSAYQALAIPGLNWALMVEKDVTEALEPAGVLAREIITAAGIVAVAVAGVAILLGLLIARSISRPLMAVVKSMEDISEGEGDLTRRLDADRSDEIGRLAKAFNRFVERIHLIVREVTQSTEQVASAAEELTQVTGETRAGVQTQQQQLDQAAVAMNEMTATVQEVARSTGEAAQAATEANSAIGEATTRGQSARGDIETLAALATDASAEVTRLAERSDQIGVILDVIRQIAEQTNLLALNAAIEAARAGEQGRGFAVVADEVRTLATRTQTSAGEIQEMIESLQDGSRSASGLMEQVAERAQDGIRQVQEAMERIAQSSRTVLHVTDLSTQIAAATEQQTATAEEINRNVVRINEVATQSSAAMEQVSGASVELARLASGLQDLVGGFRT